MAATTITAIKKKSDNAKLVRKTTHAVAFLAPTSVDLPAKLTDASGQLQELPETWKPVGLVTTDGYKFASDTDKAEVMALGYASAVRTDVTKIKRSVTMTALEGWKQTLLEVSRGVDLSQVKAAKDSGELTFDTPSIPEFAEYRLLIVTADGPATEEWLCGRGFPRVKLSEMPEEVWNNEDPHKLELKFDILQDATLGTACREYYAGTAAKKHQTELGYTAAS